MARAVALATATASVRIPFIRASGANGLPFLIPMDANSPTISGFKLRKNGASIIRYELSDYEWTAITRMLQSENMVPNSAMRAG